MARGGVKVSVVGDKETARKLRRMSTEAQAEVGEQLELGIRKIANQAAINAPVDTGRMANALSAGVQQEGKLSWVMNDGTEYTLVQEYTHKTKKAFIRQAVWDNENDIVKGIQARIAKGG